MAESKPRSAIGAVVLFAAAKLLFHLATNVRYGFHRDELQTLDDARHLAWGYVAYPPLTPALGRIELALFGTSLTGFRALAALAQCLVVILAALLARRLGGGRGAQWIAAAAVAISPVSLAASALFQYVSLDFLWWVAIFYFVASLIESGEGRWWIAIGATIGLGVETKYTIVFLVTGVVAAVLGSPLRTQLRSRWLWLGVAVSIAIAAPNLVWQVQHDWISLDFLHHIHARDIRIGRTDHFLLEQLYVSVNLFTLPLWITGLVALFASERLRRFRAVGIMAAVPFILFLLARGRGYYTAPLYPPLLAAGAVAMTEWSAGWSFLSRRAATAFVVVLLIAGSSVALFALPLAPIGSPIWNTAVRINGDFREELGWEELTSEVARVWNSLPSEERAHTTIYASNYGEAGAINLYGPALGLPRAISGSNSFWYRGYDDPTPRAVIVLGSSREDLARSFGSVQLGGHVRNRWGIPNEESTDHPDIFICREMKLSLPQIWPRVRSFG
jgi:4-amino-4-deoxy-L-arabinose transferase-like glycosyltransferase